MTLNLKNSNKSSKAISNLGVAIYQYYFDIETKELQKLCDRKHQQIESYLSKDIDNIKEGYFKRLQAEHKAIERALVAMQLQTNAYYEYTSSLLDEIQRLRSQEDYYRKKSEILKTWIIERPKNIFG